jgi:hypothetical protein
MTQSCGSSLTEPTAAGNSYPPLLGNGGIRLSVKPWLLTCELVIGLRPLLTKPDDSGGNSYCIILPLMVFWSVVSRGVFQNRVAFS